MPHRPLHSLDKEVNDFNILNAKVFFFLYALIAFRSHEITLNESNIQTISYSFVSCLFSAEMQWMPFV